MRILVAEDNLTSQKLIEASLAKLGHVVTCVADGVAALNALEHQTSDTPRLAILDWEMPRLAGPDVCRRIRAGGLAFQPYLLLVTARDTRADLLAGLKAGADDYLAKPFDTAELQARVQVGVRYVELQAQLAERDKEITHLKALLASK